MGRRQTNSGAFKTNCSHPTRTQSANYNLHILYILSVEVTKGVAGDGGWEETRTQSTGNEIQSTGSSEREQLILARRA